MPLYALMLPPLLLALRRYGLLELLYYVTPLRPRCRYGDICYEQALLRRLPLLKRYERLFHVTGGAGDTHRHAMRAMLRATRVVCCDAATRC